MGVWCKIRTGYGEARLSCSKCPLRHRDDLWDLQRKRNREGGSFPDLASYRDISPEEICQPAAYREAETRAGGAARRLLLYLPERIEDAPEMLFANSDSGVLHREKHLIFHDPACELDMATN